VYFVVVEISASQTEGVLSVALRVIANRAGKGKRVLYHNRITADKGVLPYPAELMHPGIRADGGIVFDDDVTCERGSVGQNIVVADAAIVRDMGLCHYQIVGAKLGDVASAFSAALQSRELAKRVALARA
jgi:hypothetical protein